MNSVYEAHGSLARSEPFEIGGFELLSRIGEGTSGVVFKARQKSLNRVVAVKILAPSIAADQKFIARFIKEAHATGQLNHPHLVSGIDAGKDLSTGWWYFAMEYVDGPSLSQLLAEQETIEERRALEIVAGVARALDCIARAGLLHRDVKPHNILLNAEGLPKLADLGLVREVDSEDPNERGRCGTPLYMSPEQIRGEIEQMDIRSDLYSLGATFFCLVTGRPPYSGRTSAEIMSSHLHDPVPQANRFNSRISPECSALICSLLQKKKEQRPESPLLVVESIERILGGSQPALAAKGRSSQGNKTLSERIAGARTKRLSVKEPLRARGTPSIGAGLLAAAVFLAGGAAVWCFLQQPARAPGDTHDASTERISPSATPPPATLLNLPIENPVGTQWKKAQLFASRFPDDHAEIVRRYTALLSAAKGLPIEQEIASALQTAHADMKKATETLWPAIEGKVAAAVGAGNFDAALAILDELPAQQQRMFQERIEHRARVISEEAENRIRPVVARVEELLSLGDPAPAQKEFETVKDVHFRALQDALTQLAERIDKERMQAGIGPLEPRYAEPTRKQGEAGPKELEASQKASVKPAATDETQWVKLLAEFDATVLEKSDPALLQAILKTARENRALAPRKDDVALLNEVGAKLIEFAERDRKAVAALVGQQVQWTIGGIPVTGRVRTVKADAIELLVKEGGAEIIQPVKLNALRAEDRAKLRSALNPQGLVEQLAAALVNLRKGSEDYKAAATFIEGAGASPLAVHYRGLIQERQGVAGEAAAEKAWGELATRAVLDKLTDTQAVELRKAFEEFKQTHGATKVAADRAQEMAALTEKLATKKTEAVTADRILLWNQSGDRATLKAEIVLYLKGKAVAQIPDIKVNCSRGMNSDCVSTEVPLRNDIVFDRMQVLVNNWTGAGGGFAEIQVFKGKENLALGRASKASDSEPEGGFALATDGEIPNRYYSSSGWMPLRGKAWIEIDFTKPLGQLPPPDAWARTRPAEPGDGTGDQVPRRRGY